MYPVPGTSETMYPVLSKSGTHTLENHELIPQAQNYVPSTLNTMYFYQKFH